MRLFAAVLFLTRIPIPGYRPDAPPNLGRATVFFPIVGLGIGALQWGFARGVTWIAERITIYSGRHYAFPSLLLALLVMALGVAITGALHLDGLADMADGFGGGRTRDDVLRIMRDHAIGSYGAIALILVLAVKTASVYLLIEQKLTFPYLLAAPLLARCAIVPIAFLLPYARAGEGGLGTLMEGVGLFQMLVSTVIALGVTLWTGGWRGGVCMIACVLATLWNIRISRRRIQGMTGDTLGANTEICEALVLATGCVLIQAG
ncbi:MAG TPA: adenosylcobinamide-GDP ribazoletransferase [Candidatus Saccharimonadales bacterium]|jgi:adenosylcobinamide-GDP ribazoletransferase|nr:adenosylcobinamide-GDP ribazoletransferase [Candidatus Saccharimonadales bacterium]